MSDHDAAPDPIDRAYVQAEAILSDEDARAARRARVLGAVARAPAMASDPSSDARRRPLWRRGGWLAAASVVVLSVFIAAQFHQLGPRQLQTAPSAPAAPAPGPPATTPAAAAPAPANPPRVARGTLPAPPAASPPEAPPIVPAAPPPIASNKPAPRAFPAAPPAPPADVVTSERAAPAPAANYAGPRPRGEADEAVEAQGETRQAAGKASGAAFAPSPGARAPSGRLEEPSGGLSSTAPPSDRAARLRAAAAAGRTGEVAALLGQGVPVDTPDDAGDTALIKSIRADHPAVAALLRSHGASLDHRNRAGESARDIAAAQGDAALNQAIGLGP